MPITTHLVALIATALACLFFAHVPQQTQTHRALVWLYFASYLALLVSFPSH